MIGCDDLFYDADYTTFNAECPDISKNGIARSPVKRIVRSKTLDKAARQSSHSPEWIEYSV
jgi:hypothetical protein